MKTFIETLLEALHRHHDLDRISLSLAQSVVVSAYAQPSVLRYLTPSQQAALDACHRRLSAELLEVGDDDAGGFEPPVHHGIVYWRMSAYLPA